jgi:hypothetical protein
MNIFNKILNLWYYFFNYDNYYDKYTDKYSDKYNKLDDICDILAEN